MPVSPRLPRGRAHRPTIGRRALLGLSLGALAAPLAGCGFQPAYAPRGRGATPLPPLDIPPIEGRVGQLVRNALIDRFTVDRDARYKLEVSVSVNEQGLGIDRDDDASLTRLEGRARFVVIDRTRRGGGEVLRPDALSTRPVSHVLEGTVRRAVTFNTFDTGYATTSSVRGASRDVARLLADDLETRLLAYFRGGARRSGMPGF